MFVRRECFQTSSSRIIGIIITKDEIGTSPVVITIFDDKHHWLSKKELFDY